MTFDLKKMMALSLIGLNVVSFCGSYASDITVISGENLYANDIVKYSVVNEEISSCVKACETSIAGISNFKNVFSKLGYFNNTNDDYKTVDEIKSVLSSIEYALFDNVKANSDFAYNDKCYKLCKKLISVAVMLSEINISDLLSIESGTANMPFLLKSFSNLKISKERFDIFLNDYKKKCFGLRDCGLCGVLEFLFNNTSGVNCTDFINGIKKFFSVADINSLFSVTINGKLNCLNGSSFSPFIDHRSTKLGTMLNEKQTDVDKLLKFLESIGYNEKISSDDVGIGISYLNLDKISEITGEQKAELSKLTTLTEIYKWISDNVGAKKDNEKPTDPDKGGEKKDEKPGTGGEGGDTREYYVKEFGKVASIEVSSQAIVPSSAVIKLAEASTDKILEKLKNTGKLSIDMGGDKQRFKRKVMKRHFSQYQPVWDDRTNDPNRRFLNISVE